MQPIKLLYYALLGGQVLFGAVVVYLVSSGMAGESQPMEMFRYAVPLLLFGSVSAAYFMSQQRIAQIETIADPGQKLLQYRMTVIIRSALVEGANLFTLVAALLEGSSTYLLYFAVGLLVFLYFRPTDNFT